MKCMIRMEELTGLAEAIKGFLAKLSSFSLCLFYFTSASCVASSNCLNQTVLLYLPGMPEILQADFQECRALMWFE